MDEISPGVWNAIRRVGNELVEFQLRVGNSYGVYPRNPALKKHRGRTGELVEIEDDVMPTHGYIRFEDNRQVGKVALSDLIPADLAAE